MKKIIFFILFTFLANAQDYSKLFNSLDSVQKSDAVNHLSKIKKLINYEILKSGIKIKEKEFFLHLNVWRVHCFGVYMKMEKYIRVVYAKKRTY